ncbi:ABC transporter substrate-binding protein [Amaricoccus solimangrovi]|uniref:ABC transporter substrate-binding protein n=1 Tax=Amaricoccus solimangrovi TaxID=2589815 RepID=A0A501WWC5_9RHOB|nr:ABC transporter substrate-binding protein [Amaricoccus solimangrovi]TPE51707.1 ABC transporter substrate-binding protein [Amaricoccus solimangrovi]
MLASLRGLTLAALLGSAALPALAETPKDQLVVGFSMTNVLTLDPAAITGREPVQILANVYDNLVTLDAKDRAKVNPDLAESWAIAPDNKSITFHLRDDAVFASGNPVTAQDVVWSLNRLMTLNLAQASFLKTHGFTKENAGASFTAPDERTVVVTLPKPVDPKVIVQTLGIVGPGSVLDSKLVMENEKDGDLGADWLNTHSAGSGKFTFDGWKANDRVILTRNGDYWGEPSAMKRVIMRHIPESQNQRLMLEKGDIDIGFSLAGPDLKALSAEEGVEVISQPGSGFYYLAVSMKDERLAKPKVREALRYLIDYDGINAAIMPYYGQAHQRPIASGVIGAMPDPGYTLDVDRAKTLLSEAGYPDGFKVTLRALADAPFMSTATAIQATLKQAGIDAEIISGSGEQIYGAMRERNFELLVGRGGGGQLPHPDSNLRAIIYNPDNSDAAKLTNFQGWRTSFYDPEINAAIDAALIESDADKQVAMYHDIQGRIATVVPSIQPFAEVLDSVAYRADLENFTLNPSWGTDLGAITKDR